MSLIRFRNVDLLYPIREQQRVTLKDFFVRTLLGRRSRRPTTIHALKNLSFAIHDGERVGVVGFNGAGKSTLLRTIAGIYPLAGGERLVEGRVCSLFEITVGFEPDATGIENIYYRSYLQGETPRTVQRRLREIADFCELGEFLHLPVRCYSSGMVMRLAFAVATSSQPEILLIDEVFDTGDVLFQKKAEARMRDLLQRARIVVMVGHHLEFLHDFCTRVLWLHQGELLADGPPHEIIPLYAAGARPHHESDAPPREAPFRPYYLETGS